MIFPVIELVDRFAIAKLKLHKTNGANREEFDFYDCQLNDSGYALGTIEQELDQLYRIHSKIWNLEAELKSGRESELSLEELGRRAIMIRNLNNQRIQLKNSMAEQLGCSVREIKKDHLSE
jgi:hypothetical protein